MSRAFSVVEPAVGRPKGRFLIVWFLAGFKDSPVLPGFAKQRYSLGTPFKEAMLFYAVYTIVLFYTVLLFYCFCLRKKSLLGCLVTYVHIVCHLPDSWEDTCIPVGLDPCWRQSTWNFLGIARLHSLELLR